ncbi:hypothetical protein PanWU01x14_336010 [Parasponia andersonii]|uniref:Transmembrane protein n=1 Tax=Parasponia andersonii TaxID=3476 RepID=A0A2P5AG51_PARAD|nr:hypothetical protein PanWU01x14_336010 [Parasponia andersonii]
MYEMQIVLVKQPEGFLDLSMVALGNQSSGTWFGTSIFCNTKIDGNLGNAVFLAVVVVVVVVVGIFGRSRGSSVGRRRSLLAGSSVFIEQLDSATHQKFLVCDPSTSSSPLKGRGSLWL